MKRSRVAVVTGCVAAFLIGAGQAVAIDEDLRTADGGSRSDQHRPANFKIIEPELAPQAPARPLTSSDAPSRVAPAAKRPAKAATTSAKARAAAEKQKKADLNAQLEKFSRATRAGDTKAAEAAKQEILQLSSH